MFLRRFQRLLCMRCRIEPRITPGVHQAVYEFLSAWQEDRCAAYSVAVSVTSKEPTYEP